MHSHLESGCFALLRMVSAGALSATGKRHPARVRGPDRAWTAPGLSLWQPPQQNSASGCMLMAACIIGAPRLYCTSEFAPLCAHTLLIHTRSHHAPTPCPRHSATRAAANHRMPHNRSPPPLRCRLDAVCADRGDVGAGRALPCAPLLRRILQGAHHHGCCHARRRRLPRLRRGPRCWHHAPRHPRRPAVACRHRAACCVRHPCASPGTPGSPSRQPCVGKVCAGSSARA